MTTLTGRTDFKWLDFRVGDNANTMRSIAVNSLSIVGIRYNEQNVSAFQDAVTVRLPMFPDVPIEFSGPLDAAAAAVSPLLSGSQSVLIALAGDTSHRSLDIVFGMRATAENDSPRFGITRTEENGYMLTDYEIDPKSMMYKARAVLCPGSDLPTWGNSPHGIRAIVVHIITGVCYCENIYDAVPVWKSLNGSLSAAASAAITGLAVNRYSHYVYAVSPAAFFRAEFVDGAASQVGLSVAMDTTTLTSVLGGTTPVFNSVGGRLDSVDAMFFAQVVITGVTKQTFFHVDNNLTMTPGATATAPTGYQRCSPTFSWGDGEAALGFATSGSTSGFFHTSNYGSTYSAEALRSTTGTTFHEARAGSTQNMGVYAQVAYNKIQNSTDNGYTVTDVSSTYTIPADTFCWAANSDNSFGLATIKRVSDSKFFLASTVDGGATWVTISEQTNSGNLFRGFVYIFGSTWLWGDDTKAYMSTNNGSSSTDVTGNLFSDFKSAGLVIDVRSMEYFG